MVIDIDNFKSVNDVYGHTMGDHVISVIAGVISSQFRSTDYVGRVGGDEFAVLMGDIPSKEIALIKAENLVNLVKYKENLSIPENISISVGIAFSNPRSREKDATACSVRKIRPLIRNYRLLCGHPPVMLPACWSLHCRSLFI